MKDFTLRVKEGEKLILLGASGSGKSSILKLLMGIERSQGGEISIGNRQLSTLPEESLFRSISYIQQEVFIFDGSIYENITLFQDYGKEELELAIEKSGLKNLISEKGLDYPCGENGAALSGGERQRINIARSLLRKTPMRMRLLQLWIRKIAIWCWIPFYPWRISRRFWYSMTWIPGF